MKSALEALSTRPGRSTLMLDFDGVLAPIIDDPGASQPLPGNPELLQELAVSLSTVAVISGRPLSFLRERVGVPGVRLIGSYGAETLHEGKAVVVDGVREYLGRVAEARARLEDGLRDAVGVHVETKSVSVAAHWRRAPDRPAAEALVRTLTAAIAASTGLHAEPGKFVVELRPPVQMDKATTVARLLDAQAAGVAAYAGDDLGDLGALRRTVDRGGYALLVDHGSETPEPLRHVATETFDGVHRFQAWLEALVVSSRSGSG